MTDDKTQTGELSVSAPGGWGAAIRGFGIEKLVCIIAAFGIGYVAVILTAYIAEAKDQNKSVAQALKESNKEIAQALKETQAQTSEAIKQMSEQQRRANEIGREQTCLLTLPPDRRTNAGEFCKRLSRERDR